MCRKGMLGLLWFEGRGRNAFRLLSYLPESRSNPRAAAEEAVVQAV